MKTFFAVAILSALCASAFASGNLGTEYRAWTEPQRPWATEPGARVDSTYSLPVYYGMPERPYIVLGRVFVFCHESGVDPAQAVRSAVSAARAHHADAIALHKMTDADRYEISLHPDQRIYMVAAAIKWK
jgi:hypothetical protein